MESRMERVDRAIPVDNQTESKASRTTKEGKQVTYKMKVLQQPQRARACGAGAKSSADRRPVDPPPIVELKIYEDQGGDAETDVTFNMNANYFLFATLEQARPMAHGRVPEDKQRLTVLTGTPVAGMVYLDRPAPAGYFIFPDLSVRHEGKYRLSFSLYEELKNPQEEDKDENPSGASTPGDAHVTHRLEVKSEPFTVFSAKKFPGLTESTSLSRMVAEQGCRVRIRRDVRMRRRETKASGKDWEEYEDDTAQARARMSGSPDPSAYAPSTHTTHGWADPIARPRTASNASHLSVANPLSRRTSSQDMNQTFQQPFSTGPHTPHNGYAQTSPYGPSPTQQYQQPPFMQQQPPPMQPPPPQYHSQHSYPTPPAMSAPVSAPQGYYGYTTAPPSATLGHSQYPSSSGYESATQPHRMSFDYASSVGSDHRRPSANYTAPPPQAQYASQTPSHQAYQPPPTPAQQSMYPSQHLHQPSYGSLDSYSSRVPPLQPVQPPARANGASTPTPLSARSSLDHRLPSQLPPLHVPTDGAAKLEPSPMQTTSSDSYYPATSAAADSRKRSHGSVFRGADQYEPLRQGARPGESYNAGQLFPAEGAFPTDDDHDGHSATASSMRSLQYPRADGRMMRRNVPAHSRE